MVLPNLTQHERDALSVPINLADGHARHTMSLQRREHLARVVSRAILNQREHDVVGSERRFVDAFAREVGVRFSAHYYDILYSASLAIDAVAKLLQLKRYRTGLVQPTFDNIADLLRSANVDLVAVPERELFPLPNYPYIESLRLEAIFIVLPNNPTGASWNRSTLSAVLKWAAERGTLLVIDFSFRLFDPSLCWDQLDEADRWEGDLIIIDDTGKALSVLDAKAGVLSATHRFAESLHLLVTDMLLNVSGTDMLLLAETLAQINDVDPEVSKSREVVTANRLVLRKELSCLVESDFLRFSADASTSVEWIRCAVPDEQIVSAAADRGLAVLPGYRFFWDGNPRWRSNYIRVALLRDPDRFEKGAKELRSAATTVGANVS